MKSAKVSILCVLAFVAINASAGDYYQIGTNWDKRPFTPEDLASGSVAAKKGGMAVGKVAGGGTIFYLGKINGHHLAATNHHVYPFGCRGEVIPFPNLKKVYTCTNLVGTWQRLDLTIFEMRVPASDDAELEGKGLKFAFHADSYPGQKLTTVGYGHHKNPKSIPMIDESEDCRVYSAKNEVVLKADPSEQNVTEDTFKVYSIAHGCESSHGDSGSAILDRETGDIVAVLWGATFGRPARGQDSKYLQSLIDKPVPADIWGLLNYGTSVRKIHEVLSSDVADPEKKFDGDNRETLKALLSR